MSAESNPFMPPAEVDDHPTIVGPTGIDYGRLTGVENGLRIVYYGIVAIILAVIIAIPAAFIMPMLIIVPGALAVVGWLMVTFGPFFCLTAPPETEARNFVIAAITCNVLAFIARVVPNVVGAMAGNSLFLEIVEGIGGLFGLAGWILFLLFLMRMASYLQRDDIRSKAKTVLLGSLILITLVIPIAILSATVNQALGIFMIALAIGFLLLFLMYVDVIRQVFKEIAAGKVRTARISPFG